MASGWKDQRKSKRDRLRRIRDEDRKAFESQLYGLEFKVFPALTLRWNKDQPARYWTIGFNQEIPLDVGEDFLVKAIEARLEDLKNELKGKIKIVV